MKRQVDYNGFYENILKNSFNVPFQLNSDDVLENVSQIQKYKPFINFLKRLWAQNALNFKFQGLFLSDYPETHNIYFGYIDEVVNSEDEKSMIIPFYYYTDVGRLNSYNLSYNLITDTLTIEISAQDEEFLTKDNVKSVFNQSIIGTGNITLYRHKLTLTYTGPNDGPADVYLDWLSTSNLNVDSLQDLQTILKVSRNDTSDTSYLCYNGNITSGLTFSHSTGVFKITDEYGEYNVNSVSDKVTTI